MDTFRLRVTVLLLRFAVGAGGLVSTRAQINAQPEKPAPLSDVYIITTSIMNEQNALLNA
jgi:hypothetical protein